MTASSWLPACAIRSRSTRSWCCARPRWIRRGWLPAGCPMRGLIRNRAETVAGIARSAAGRDAGDRRRPHRGAGIGTRSWLERARATARGLPAGAPAFDPSGVRNTDEADEQRRDADERRWQDYVAGLRTQPGIVVTEAEAARRQVPGQRPARSAGGRSASCCARRGSIPRCVVARLGALSGA